VAGDDQVGDLEDLPARLVELVLVLRLLVLGRGVGVEPAVGRDHDAVRRAHDEREVLGGVSRRARDAHGRAEHPAVALGVLPLVAPVDRPVVVDGGVREQPGVHRVVGMVMAEDHLGDVLGSNAEPRQRFEHRCCAGRHARIDHDHAIAVAHQRARAADGAAGGGQRAIEHGVDAGGAAAGNVHCQQATAWVCK
jgi:hypothetical protein